MTQIRQKLDQRAVKDQIPTVSIYDQKADAKTPERTTPAVERNTERTRGSL